jgi:transposase-like protein
MAVGRVRKTGRIYRSFREKRGMAARGDHDRRRMILDALSPGANTSRIARAHGIHRNTLHEHITRAVRDPEGQWRRVQEEASFRRKVYEL